MENPDEYLKEYLKLLLLYAFLGERREIIWRIELIKKFNCILSEKILDRQKKIRELQTPKARPEPVLAFLRRIRELALRQAWLALLLTFFVPQIIVNKGRIKQVVWNVNYPYPYAENNRGPPSKNVFISSIKVLEK